MLTLPPFERSGNLPPGLHQATWREFIERFGVTPHRLVLAAGLKMALKSLRAAGCGQVFIDGSFVTEKVVPGDFDSCWDITGVDPSRLDPVLLEFANK